MAGTGVWLAGLVSAGLIDSDETQIQVYYGLLSRLFLAPGESAFAAKGIGLIFDLSFFR